MRARLLLVDDHQVVRDCLRLVIRDQPDMEIAGEAALGSHALTETTRLQLDVIIMDIHLNDMNGIEVRKILSVINRFEISSFSDSFANS